MDVEHRWIADRQGLEEALDTLGDGPLGIDLEADSFHRYRERLCLIQLSNGRDHFLVDPLSGLDLGPLARWLLPPLSRLVGFLPSRSDIRDPEALARHPSYERMPVAAVLQLIELGRRVRATLERFEAPLQLVYSRRDRVVPLTNADLIRGAVASAVCHTELLDESGHVMPVDIEGERVAKIAVSFLGGLERRDLAEEGTIDG